LQVKINFPNLIYIFGDFLLITIHPSNRAYNIGPYYHIKGLSPIAKVLWHPMSESGSHLMILTEDMLLRLI